MSEDDFEGLGPASDPTALWLSAALRSDPPPALVRRIDGIVVAGPRPRTAGVWRWAALGLAASFWVHGFGSIFFSDWLVQNLGEDAPHAMFEGGVAVLTVALLVGAAALRRSWAPVAVAGGTPMGVIYGLHGIREWGTFAAGAALHTLEGVLALVLLVTFVLELRDSRGARHEEGA